jgi:hypothetical protein
LTRIIIVLALTLAGCASQGMPAASICPRIENFSAADNAALAAALAALPGDDVLRKVANEDHRLRVELRACNRSIRC